MAKKVLIVEDSAGTRSFMKVVLEGYGHQVLEASDGEEAIKIAGHEQLDLILMDLGIPTIDGLTTTRVIRALEKGKTLPIIALTGYGIDNEQAVEAGCNELIFKPLDIDSFEFILNKYLAQ